MTIEPSPPISRRRALGVLTAFAGGVVTGCLGPEKLPASQVQPLLKARPGVPTLQGPAGRSSFDVGNASGEVYAPASLATEAPLLVFLHGANRSAAPYIDAFVTAADAAGVLLLAPYALYNTWDFIGAGDFAFDVGRINVSLTWMFDRWRVSPSRIVLAGFSDGGTYALAMGRANGDLFARVVAFSPGFLIPVDAVGRPPILISHGTSDTVLPIAQTSRVIVPELRGQGYDVDYREFAGGHAVPLSVANEVIASLGA